MSFKTKLLLPTLLPVMLFALVAGLSISTTLQAQAEQEVAQIARAIDSVASQTQIGVKTVDELNVIGDRLQSLLGQFKI